MKSEVFNKNCLDVMAKYEDKYFDLCLTDPPYGVGLEYNTYDDSLENWYELMNGFIPEARRVSKMVIMPACSINKLQWIYQNHPPNWLMAWYKGSTGHNSYVGFNSWEPLLVYGKTESICIHDVIKINNTEKMGEHNHPCPKPVIWFQKLYSQILKGNGKVLDCFAGSGTSRIAAEREGLEYVGCEIDESYYLSQEKRFKLHLSQPRLNFTAA